MMGRVTSGLAEHTTDLLAELERVHSTLMSPLVWDLAHIAAFEDLWLVRRGGEREMLRPELAHVYDAFETPRAQRGDLPMLDRAGARRYLDDVRGDVLERSAAGDPPDPRRLELVLR